MCDLLWSDPLDPSMYPNMKSTSAWLPSNRGCGYLFGKEVTKEFNHNNGLKLIARAH